MMISWMMILIILHQLMPIWTHCVCCCTVICLFCIFLCFFVYLSGIHIFLKILWALLIVFLFPSWNCMIFPTLSVMIINMQLLLNLHFYFVELCSVKIIMVWNFSCNYSLPHLCSKALLRVNASLWIFTLELAVGHNDLSWLLWPSCFLGL